MSTYSIPVSASKNSMVAASSIVIRKVSSENAEDALLLIEEYYHEVGVLLRDDRSTLLDAINTPGYGIWIAFSGAIPAGCVMIRPLENILGASEVKRLYVRANFRTHGIAKALMKAVEASARAQGNTWLYLDTKDDLVNAIRFYEKHGYERCSRYNNNPQATIFMRKQLVPDDVVVRPFQSGDEDTFRSLNEAWITAYFQIEREDREALDHPVEKYLQPGGQIFMALQGNQAIGCCALLRMKDGGFEVSKMTVDERQRGRGVGRKLLQAVIDYARAKGISRLYLETNSTLTSAIHLYAALGFEHIPEERRTPSPYARADVFMEMYLQENR